MVHWGLGGRGGGTGPTTPVSPEYTVCANGDRVTQRRGYPGRGECHLQWRSWLQGQHSSEFGFHRIKSDRSPELAAMSDGGSGALWEEETLCSGCLKLSFRSGATRGSVCLLAPDRRGWMVPGEPGRPGESAAGHAAEAYRHPFAIVTAHGRCTCVWLCWHGPALSWLYSITVQVNGEGSSQVPVQLCTQVLGRS